MNTSSAGTRRAAAISARVRPSTPGTLGHSATMTSVQATAPFGGAAWTLGMSQKAMSGFVQELVYRAFMVPVLLHQFGSRWTAVLLSSVLFSAIHLYQGPKGVLSTFFMGVIFAIGFLATGRFWPLAIAHAASLFIHLARS